MTARGLRNFNPGNIEFTETKWQGLDDPPSDGRFCRFTSPAYGIRAIARTLITYQGKYDINTIRGVVTRWAPSVENNTEAYILSAATTAKRDADEPLDLQSYADCRAVVEAIIMHENGSQPYPSATLDQGLLMAGVKPPTKPAVRDPKVIGAALLSSATVAGQAVSQFEGIWNTLNRMGISPHILMAIVGVAALGVAVYLVRDYMRSR